MLFYFTGTGNSLYIAKQLDENIVSIPQIIDKDKLSFEADVIGIVCPVYCHKPPKMVIEFLKKAELKADYIYAVLTYGNRHCGAAENTYNLAKENGIEIDYIANLLMVDNYLPVFDMNEQRAIDKNVDKQMEAVKKDISARKKFIPLKTDEERAADVEMEKINRDMPAFNNGEQIKVTEKCVGCGICSKVCPTGNFYIENGKAVRKKATCEFCLACANCCPEKAIVTSIMDKNPNARYINENISLSELIKANCRL